MFEVFSLLLFIPFKMMFTSCIALHYWRGIYGHVLLQCSFISIVNVKLDLIAAIHLLDTQYLITLQIITSHCPFQNVMFHFAKKNKKNLHIHYDHASHSLIFLSVLNLKPENLSINTSDVQFAESFVVFTDTCGYAFN